MKEEIAKFLIKQGKIKSIKKEDIVSALEIPPNIELGDYAFPCFKLAQEFKKSPIQI